MQATFTLNTYLLTVSKTGTGSGSVTSDPSGIDCGSTCSASYDYGTPVTLSAVASPGSTFTGWSGACSGTGTCVVTMSVARNVMAEFTVEQCSVSKLVADIRNANSSGQPTTITLDGSCTYIVTSPAEDNPDGTGPVGYR